MNIAAGIALFLSGLSLGMTIVNIGYSIIFRIESREESQHSKHSSGDGGNG